MKRLFTLSILFGFISFASIAQITYVNQAASGADNGTSWTDAYNDLSDALRNTDSGELWIAAGVYKPGPSDDTLSTFMVNSPLKIYGGFKGDETDLSQRDWNTNKVILNGDLASNDNIDDFDTNKEDNARHVVVVDSLITETVVFDGITVSNGHSSSGNDAFISRGGGIYTYSTIHINNCNFTQNYASNGAAVFIGPYAEGNGGDNSTFENSNFYNNQTDNRGIVYFFGLNNITAKKCNFYENTVTRGAFYLRTSDNVQVLECSFDNNRGLSLSSFGGALFDWQCTNSVIRDCTFFGNTAGNGVVLYSDGREVLTNDPNDIRFINNTCLNNVGNDSRIIATWKRSILIDSCKFERNVAPQSTVAGFSGDLAVDNENVIVRNSEFISNTADWSAGITNWGVNLTLEDCFFNNNSADRSGTSLNIGNLSTNIVNNCNFLGNSGQWGGAMYFQNDSSTALITNSSFNFNEVTNSGGAINNAGGNTVTIEDCQFSNNTADFGGAISSSSDEEDTVEPSFEITNCEFLSNQATTQGAGLSLVNTSSNITNCEITNNINSNDGTSGGSGGALSLNSAGDDVVEINLINCTLADNFAEIGSGLSGYTDSIATLTVNIQNTLFKNEGNNYLIESGTPVINSNGGNISNDASMESILTNTNDLNNTDPLFSNPLLRDFTLAAGSPAIGNGIEAGAPTTDIEGNNRLWDIDSGAYEYLSTGLEDVEIVNTSFKVFPNPCRDMMNVDFNNNWKGNLNFVIVNSVGKEISKQIFNKNENHFSDDLNVAGLIPGSYELIIINEGEAMTASFIKL